ncbi:MAG: DUF2064 domain-containing protein [Thermoanaerobaculia bacterium]|nr:DUF2064 domain-containing protein [Thermoanaerobaculia bacterium]
MSSDTSSDATLLVFTLGPAADSRRRPVLPPRLGGLERGLRWGCLGGILDAGRDCGVDLAVATDADLDLPADVRRVEQSGRTFAARLAGAVRRAESSRPDRPLVVVGADLPGFRRTHLDDALARLADDPDAVVVGPSPDGGVYLIAARRPLAGVFERVEWCREHTRSHLIEVLARRGHRVVLLPPLADLDRPGDLAHLLAGDRSSGFGPRLARALREALRRLCRPIAACEISLPRLDLLRLNPHRGPPA